MVGEFESGFVIVVFSVQVTVVVVIAEVVDSVGGVFRRRLRQASGLVGDDGPGAVRSVVRRRGSCKGPLAVFSWSIVQFADDAEKVKQCAFLFVGGGGGGR